jgi:hypothetical protein
MSHEQALCLGELGFQILTDLLALRRGHVHVLR